MTQWGLDNLFNPGKRHMDDEKRRLQSTREEIGDASGGRRIDLEAGKVSISVRRPTDVGVDDATDDDTALAPAVEAEDIPAVALANDEAEIVPDLVDETVDDAPEPAAEPEAAVIPDADTDAKTDDVPSAAPEPVITAPRRRQLSASAWSRRG